MALPDHEAIAKRMTRLGIREDDLEEEFVRGRNPTPGLSNPGNQGKRPGIPGKPRENGQNQSCDDPRRGLSNHGPKNPTLTEV